MPPNAYDSMQPTIVGVCIFLMVWSTAMITARIYTRKFIIDSMGWDDYACIVGWVSFADPPPPPFLPTFSPSDMNLRRP